MTRVSRCAAAGVAGWRVHAGPAPLGVAVPAPVQAVAAGRPARLAWQNEVGGLTFDVGAGPDRCFVKWVPTASGIDLGREAARLTWAALFTPVPTSVAGPARAASARTPGPRIASRSGSAERSGCSRTSRRPTGWSSATATAAHRTPC